ncbi:ExbD/TolR family protein [Cerasicoccus maritimus]|uniref:ExbD/TolR family protein n=1 Tax=Cerasicoccus maritimus TaxID=490089 RepID=UPI0028526BB4|nr:biopolymer transporter ExbD [Cerasicoccus maritimus]
MSRRSVLSEGEEEPEINLSSMIDCIFILLIFFIVTTVFVEETGVQVNKPDASANPAENNEESDNVMLEITSNNKVIYNGEEIPLSQVKNVVKKGMKDSETPVMIRSNEHASHGVFISVWDQAAEAGAELLSFTTTN